MPGSPPTRIAEAGTRPPPSTRSSSAMPVGMRGGGAEVPLRPTKLDAPPAAGACGPGRWRRVSAASSTRVFHSPQASQRPCHFGMGGAAGLADEAGAVLGHGDRDCATKGSRGACGAQPRGNTKRARSWPGSRTARNCTHWKRRDDVAVQRWDASGASRLAVAEKSRWRSARSVPMRICCQGALPLQPPTKDRGPLEADTGRWAPRWGPMTREAIRRNIWFATRKGAPRRWRKQP